MNRQSLDKGIRQVHATGSAYVPGLLPGCLSRRLLAEVDPACRRLPASKYHLPEEPVWVAGYTPTQYEPALASLVADFGQAVRTNAALGRAGGASSLESWYPSEAVFQGYADGGGISAHRDFSDCRLLIAIFNLQGSAQLSIERYSPDWVAGASWELGRGDLVLLRGTDFQGVKFYGRPRHWVDHCGQDRVSLVLRMLVPTPAA